MAMICPKCRGEMASYERNGITVDQCTECRGLFLDRGELEHLINAEQAWAAAPAREPEGYRQPEPHRQYEQPRESDRGEYRGEYNPRYDKRQKKKKSFFEDLFD